MATALPVVQAFDATTYNVTNNFWTPYLTIPHASFTIGHRYLIIGHADVRSYYDGTYHDAVVVFRWNGLDINSGSSICRSESTKFQAVPFMEVFTTTGSSGTGLQMGAFFVNGTGGQIKNLRIVVVDLDVNNTDLPQQSANGWLYSANESFQSLTTSWAPYVTMPTFTPDGVSDYLIIACGQVYNVFNGRGALGIMIDGVPWIGTYSYVTTYGSPGNLLTSYVARLPNSPTSISLMAHRTGSTGTINCAHLFAIRLNTFTKYAGHHIGTPTQTTGTSWQSAISITPTPASSAGESFLVFSRIQGITWVSGDATFSERILRNPGSTEVIAGSTANHQDTSDYFGPTLCQLDTADGANTYELQFKRDNYSDRPATFYQATLVAVKAEVGYTASTKKSVAFLAAGAGGGTDLPEDPTWTTYTSIPGYKLISGHRYLVFMNLQHYVQGTGTLQARARLLMDGVEVAGSRHQESHSGVSYYTPAASFVLVTGTGTGNGVELQGQKLGSSNAQLRLMRLVAVDLDADATLLPQQSDTGWKYAETLTQVANGSSYATVQSLSFTPDGTSDYLVVGDVELYSDVAGSGYGFVQLLNGSNGIFATAYNDYYYTDGSTAGMRTHFPIMYRFSAPSASPITLNLQAKRSSSAYPYVAAARLFVLRLNCFESRGDQYNAIDYSNPSADVWLNILNPAVPAPAPSLGENVLTLAAWQMQWQGTQPSWEQDYRVLESDQLTTLTTDYNIYGNNPTDTKNMLLASIDTVSFDNVTYKLQDKNPVGVGNATILRHRLFVVLGSTLYADAFDDVAADGSISISGSATDELERNVSMIGSADFSGDAGVERLASTSASGTIVVDGDSVFERIRQFLASSTISVQGVAHGFTAEGLPLPTVARVFSQATGIDVTDLMDAGLWGNDAPAVKNRLKVVGSTQLGIDPLYGGSYVFDGPPTTSPVRLGFQRGDKIYLFQAQGETAGPNVGKILTIFDPATLEVMEALVHPDSTPYKFFAVKRGR